jgi:hypothetical protein
MILSKFRVELQRTSIKATPLTLDDLRWDEWRLLADLTKYFDFDCRFTEFGCKTNKNNMKMKDTFMEYYDGPKAKWNDEVYKWGSKIKKNVMCCCRSCRGTMGWALWIEEESIPKMARYFNDKTGYWRPNIGCVLPRKYRSKTCLTHSCRREDVKPQRAWRLLAYYLRVKRKVILEHHYEQTGDRCSTISEVAQSLKTMIHMERRKRIGSNSK